MSLLHSTTKQRNVTQHINIIRLSSYLFFLFLPFINLIVNNATQQNTTHYNISPSLSRALPGSPALKWLSRDHKRVSFTLACIVIMIVGHLWRHKHASHYEKEEVQKKYTSDKFVCNFDGCMVTFDTQPELVEHVKTHTTDKACMCSECGATFVSLPNLAKHTRRRHGDQAPPTYKGYRCEKCDKTFLTSYQLVVHFRLDKL